MTLSSLPPFYSFILMGKTANSKFVILAVFVQLFQLYCPQPTEIVRWPFVQLSLFGIAKANCPELAGNVCPSLLRLLIQSLIRNRSEWPSQISPMDDRGTLKYFICLCHHQHLHLHLPTRKNKIHHHYTIIQLLHVRLVWGRNLTSGVLCCRCEFSLCILWLGSLRSLALRSKVYTKPLSCASDLEN